MNQLRRYYNQNRKKIWGLIIIIAFAFALLQLVNYFTKVKNQRTVQNANIQQQAKNNTTNTTGATNTSGTSNNTQRTKSNDATDTINQFATYCNKKELENAYNMITDECKEQMFRDIETFERIYYNSTFDNKSKEITIENWADNTYMVTFKESALSAGKNMSKEQHVDYITPVKDGDNNYKLNINSYIGYKKLEKSKESDGIKIEAVSKNTYLNYEEYKIKITNNTETNVVLDKLGTVRSMYIEDSKGVTYPSYNHELTTEMLTVSAGHTKEIDIKFYSSYISNKKINSIVFANMRKANNQIQFKIEL